MEDKIKEITKYLMDLGLNETEIKIYLTLLKSGSENVTKLSKKTEIPRTSVHRHLDKLIEKGLISQIIKNNVRTITAEDPKKIRAILKENEIELETELDIIKTMQDKLPKIINSLNSTLPQNTKKSKFNIRYYNEEKEVMSIYREAFQAKSLYSYVNLEESHKVFSKNKKLYIELNKIEIKAKVREIVANTPKCIEIAKSFEKEVDFQYKISTDELNTDNINMMMFDNKLAIINLCNGVYGIIIEDEEIYKTQLNIFNSLWKIL